MNKILVSVQIVDSIDGTQLGSDIWSMKEIVNLKPHE